MDRLVNEIIDHQHIAGLGFTAGVLVTVACYALPSIWHCPTNPLLGPMVQLRKKRSRLAGQNSAFGQFELKDHYGLEQQVLNLDFDPRTMWMNVGFWKVSSIRCREPSKSFLTKLIPEQPTVPRRSLSGLIGRTLERSWYFRLQRSALFSPRSRLRMCRASAVFKKRIH